MMASLGLGHCPLIRPPNVSIPYRGIAVPLWQRTNVLLLAFNRVVTSQVRACLSVLTQGGHGSARTCSLHCTLTPAACAARSARSAPGPDTRSGQGALARRHTDGPLWAALLKATVMCEAWRPRTIAPPDPSRTSATSGDFGQS
jgi:hypothetical protein